MRSFLALVSLMASAFWTTSALKPVPDFIHVCSKADPNIKACIVQSVEELRPFLKSGVPEHHIPSVEPIYIKDLIKEETAGLKVVTTDVVAHGGGDFVVQDVIVDLEKHEFEVDILIPKLVIDAKYTVDGKVVLVPIKGSGDFFANLTDCSARAILTTEMFTDEDGETHMRLIKNDMKINVGGGHVRLDNLFGGDKFLNDVINDTINKNLNAFVKEMLPFIEKGLAEHFLTIGNRIIEPYAVRQLFP